MTYSLETDGFSDLSNETLALATGKYKYPPMDHTNAKDQERFMIFWAVNGGALGICTLAEIAGLYYFGMKNSVRVANKLDMRLLPLNRDRATVAQSLIRAALELGQANTVMFGVDPLRDHTRKSAVIEVVIAILYAAKIFLTGFMMKGTISASTSRSASAHVRAHRANSNVQMWCCCSNSQALHGTRWRQVCFAMDGSTGNSGLERTRRECYYARIKAARPRCSSRCGALQRDACRGGPT